MKKYPINHRYTLLSVAVAVAMAGCGGSSSASVETPSTLDPAQAYVSTKHIFSMDDVQGGFNGSTYGSVGTSQVSSIFCGVAGSPGCPADIKPLTDKDGTVLYPVDSEFGFYVSDSLGAQQKAIDGDYKEGFAGNIIGEGGVLAGIRISNASTDVYKVPAGMGSWCRGLGGTMVKCSTEHYTVMEHVLSCFETVPYRYADAVTGVQAVQTLPDGREYNCDNAQLDDVLNIIANGVDTGMQLTDATVGVQMGANDLTTITDNYAKGKDYSVTLKDDGKPLYMWGTAIKRPNDLRMYAKIALPEVWKVAGADFAITSAKLVVKHVVTNNPNDQLRPEDLENEAAIGRLPSVKVTKTDKGEVWTSLKSCYEGDGDLIDADEGSAEATFIEAGTVLKNTPFAVDGTDPTEPLPFSADLRNGYTNAGYTTVDREPFEWAYLKNADMAETTGIYEFVSSPVPNPTLGLLTSGPRWRLKPNKFGQDLPGLEIPLNECTPPPYQNDNIKYEVGAPVTTVINLLDWDTEGRGPSPLATSKGWVDVTQNGFVKIGQTVDGVSVSTNGLPMTNDFDLAVYVKGDKKPTSVYSAQLFINIEPTTEDLAPYVDPNIGGGGNHQ